MPSLSERRIYVACLAAYNSGHLHGQWIDADQSADDIQEEVNAMLASSPKKPETNILVGLGFAWAIKVNASSESRAITRSASILLLALRNGSMVAMNCSQPSRFRSQKISSQDKFL